MGSSNAALVIVNSYWISFDHCSFTFYPDYRANGSTTASTEKGQVSPRISHHNSCLITRVF